MTKKLKPEEAVAEMIRPHAGKWVTLSSDKKTILGSSARMETALSQAHKKGEQHPHLIKAPDSSIAAYIY